MTADPPDSGNLVDSSDVDDGEYYEAIRIKKQRMTRAKGIEYLVEWAPDKNTGVQSSPSWVRQDDTTQALRDVFYRSHTLTGKLRKTVVGRRRK